jgi:hypothetical protein
MTESRICFASEGVQGVSDLVDIFMGTFLWAPTPHPRCGRVNTVDKGVTARNGVNAVDKGVTARLTGVERTEVLPRIRVFLKNRLQALENKRRRGVRGYDEAAACHGAKRERAKAIKSGVGTERQSQRGKERTETEWNCGGADARGASTAERSMRGTREQLVGGTVGVQLAEKLCERECVRE